MWRIFFLAHLGLSVADPDFQISGGGGGMGRLGGGDGDPDPEIRGGPGGGSQALRAAPLDMQFYNSRDVRRSAAH